MNTPENYSLNRKEFLKLTTGIIGGLGISVGVTDWARAAENKAATNAALDDSYLVKGLTGMVRAEGWFNAHWGAGILAGYYLCKENQFSEPVVAGIKRQMDAVIRMRPEQFALLPKESSDGALINAVPRALVPAMNGGLRAHGHAVIFASLSTRALRDIPELASPTVINGLCGLSNQIAQKVPDKPLDSSMAYSTTQEMIEATFDSLIRFRGLLGHPSIRRPNFTHMITHTEALMNLELMGYDEIARSGHLGHGVHISAPVPQNNADAVREDTSASLESMMQEEFWNDPVNQDRWHRKQNIPDNPNGDWIASGHLFKVLYSYHRLIERIADLEKIDLCSRILLERYMNPEVRGG